MMVVKIPPHTEVDQMALAVAYAEPSGEPLSSMTFGVFRPVEFYIEDGVGARLEAYLHDLPLDQLNQRSGDIRFAAALFSWGDVARETAFAEGMRQATEPSCQCGRRSPRRPDASDWSRELVRREHQRSAVPVHPRQRAIPGPGAIRPAPVSPDGSPRRCGRRDSPAREPLRLI